jgi:hypothetical protein
MPTLIARATMTDDLGPEINRQPCDDERASRFSKGRQRIVKNLNTPGLQDVAKTALLKRLSAAHFGQGIAIGRSSVTLEQGLFQNGRFAAMGETVIVLMDETTRRSRSLAPTAIDRLRLMTPLSCCGGGLSDRMQV